METAAQEASNLGVLAFVPLLVMVYLTWSLPRRLAIAPLLVMVCLMPMGQKLVLLGLNFTLFRILLAVGVLRVLVRGEAHRLKWTTVDKFFAWWVLVSVVFGSLSEPAIDLLVNRMGDAYNAVGCYFFARCVLLELEDVVVGVRTLAFACVPLAALMLVEKTTGHNLLAIFGGVPALTILREGHVRCQGAFRHPILAGTFGATMFPLFVGLWFYKPHRRIAIAAALSSLIVAVTASSSGAIMAVIAGAGAFALWRFRNRMRLIRWGALLAILILSLVMQSPVWYLFAKLSNVAGGTGWHRAYLIDQTISHFNEWWLFGTVVTAHWGPSGEVIAADPRMMDITNHYVMEGVKGGVLKLALFVAILVQCFKAIGRARRAQEPGSPDAFFVWAMGVALFTHCLSFLSITYFDQSVVVLYWLMAAIVCITGFNGRSFPTPTAFAQRRQIHGA